jgi:epoxide hydrolase-like predicted phosphatase
MAACIEAVAFDFGGVMVSFTDLKSFAEAGASLGLEVGELHEAVWSSPEWQQALVGAITDEEFWQRLGPRLGLGSEEEIDRFVTDLFRDEAADPRMVELVRRLRGSYRTGLLSNASDLLPSLLRERYGLDDLFDVKVISALVGVAKPDPAIYQVLLERLGTRPESTVFVDDREQNVAAAAEVGIQAIRFEGYETLIPALGRCGVGLR